MRLSIYVILYQLNSRARPTETSGCLSKALTESAQDPQTSFTPSAVARGGRGRPLRIRRPRGCTTCTTSRRHVGPFRVRSASSTLAATPGARGCSCRRCRAAIKRFTRLTWMQSGTVPVRPPPRRSARARSPGHGFGNHGSILRRRWLAFLRFCAPSMHCGQAEVRCGSQAATSPGNGGLPSRSPRSRCTARAGFEPSSRLACPTCQVSFNPAASLGFFPHRSRSSRIGRSLAGSASSAGPALLFLGGMPIWHPVAQGGDPSTWAEGRRAGLRGPRIGRSKLSPGAVGPMRGATPWPGCGAGRR
jgi:hypothetical protein